MLKIGSLYRIDRDIGFYHHHYHSKIEKYKMVVCKVSTVLLVTEIETDIAITDRVVFLDLSQNQKIWLHLAVVRDLLRMEFFQEIL